MERKYKVLNIFLAAIAVMLLCLCVVSISAPIIFKRECKARERDVKERLLVIRSAEDRFRLDHGHYCGSLDTLVSAGYLVDSLRYVPHSGGVQFRLKAGMSESGQEHSQPVVECGATYRDYLRGLDAGSVSALMEEAKKRGSYPGLKIGGMAPVDGTAPNWQ